MNNIDELIEKAENLINPKEGEVVMNSEREIAIATRSVAYSLLALVKSIQKKEDVF